MSQALCFVLPASFNPMEFLPAALRQYSDDARYFVNLILRKMAKCQIDRLGLVRLRAQHLRSIMHNRHEPAIVRALKDGGAVERYPFAAGQASFGYRLSPRFVADQHVRVPATDRRLIRRMETFFANAEAERQSRMKPVHQELASRQYQLQIDRTAARQILDQLPAASNPYDVQGILVQNIVHRDFFLNVGKFGRVANSITSMKRELRTALSVRNEPLVSVDLSCAQPALLAKVIGNGQQTGTREQATGTPAQVRCIYDAQLKLPELVDLELFRDLVQSGRLYDFVLADLASHGVNISRKSLKQRFLCDVLAKRRVNGKDYPSKVEDAVRRLFPTVYQFIRTFNGNGSRHANLIRELQRQESRFVIETVAADLVALFPRTFFITLHDAIYTTAEHLPKVEAAFHRGFEQTGFLMDYKIGTP